MSLIDEVERLTVYDGEAEVEEDGNYVSFEDYRDLAAELEVLRMNYKALEKADAKTIKELEARDKVVAALIATKGQWIHSVNAKQCIEALEELNKGE